MPVQYGNKRKIFPTTVLGGRGALAYVDDVAIMVTNVEKWTDADVIKLLEESARLQHLQLLPIFLVKHWGARHRSAK